MRIRDNTFRVSQSEYQCGICNRVRPLAGLYTLLGKVICIDNGCGDIARTRARGDN